MRAIAHVADRALLHGTKPREIASLFEQAAGRTLNEIVLPYVTVRGASTRSRFTPEADDHFAKWLPDWGDDVLKWALINPTFAFLEYEPLMVVDQYGLRVPNNACIGNSAVATLCDEFATLLPKDGSVHGVVFDITDIYPQFSSNIIRGLQNTCFCHFCISALEENGFSPTSLSFRGQNNPFKLALLVEPDGVSHIEVPLQVADVERWLRDRAVAQGFVTADEVTDGDVQEFVNYLRIRAKVVARFLKRLAEAPRTMGLRTAVILGNPHLDMSTMTDLFTLANEGAADEFWVPDIGPDEITYSRQKGCEACVYLFSRATYFINGLFEAMSPAKQISPDELIGRASRVASRTSSLTPSSVAVLELIDDLSGFVGLALDPEMLQRLVSTHLRSSRPDLVRAEPRPQPRRRN